MFQSTDDLNFDEEFLSEVFEIQQSNDQKKRFSDETNNQAVKKICMQPQDASTKNILSIIKSKSSTFSAQNSCLERLDKCRKVIQRKFPGPAGLLPEQNQSNLNITALEENDTSMNKKLEPDVILCSQFTENNFRKGPWQQMLSDWSNNEHQINLPNKYTIQWTKSKAIAKKLIGQKTPFLAAVIQSIDPSNKDPMILLKDKTDEIQATLLHEVWDEYFEFLIPGSVVVLKQVGVLSTLKKQYLAITSHNLIMIYSEHESEESENIESRITIVQSYTVSDVINIIEDVKSSNKMQKKITINEPVINNPYFKTSNYNKIDERSSNLNNSLQLISNIRSPVNAIKNCPNNELQHASPILIRNEQNTTNIPKTCSSHETNIKNTQQNNVSTPHRSIKFNFKSKINHLSNIPNKASTSKMFDGNEEDMLTQVLEGVDTASIFEDF